MSLEDCISSAPAETNASKFVSAWNVAHSVYEAIDDGARDRLSVREDPVNMYKQECSDCMSMSLPRTQGDRYRHAILRLVQEAESLLFGKWWLDVLEKGYWERVALSSVSAMLATFAL